MLYPTLKEFIKVVQENDKRVGLRTLYKKYRVSAKERPKYRKMWDAIVDDAKRELKDREHWQMVFKEEKDAFKSGKEPKSYKHEHLQTEERGLSPEAGGGDSNGESRQEEEEKKEQETVSQEKET
jgi:hypothetical protein